MTSEQTSPEPASPPEPEKAPEPPPGRRRRWLGRLAALAFGLLLLCLAELILAAAGYGGPRRLFLRVPEGGGAESYVTNYRAFRATFASNPVIRALDKYPAPPAQRFPAAKPQGVYRVAVMGGSAAMGYPHRLNGSFPRLLEEVLNVVCAGARFEVVNVGVPAVNSYSVLERCGEVLGYEADMLVVYSGHNEFYGAYGPASAIPLSSRRPVALAQMWLRSRRLSLLVADALARLQQAPDPEEEETHLVRIMPRRTDVRFGDATYERTRANYRANLSAVAAQARRRGAPVVLCTPGANLRDFPPLGSLHAPDFTAEKERDWRRLMEEARELEGAGQTQEALERLRAAAALSPGHAETRYRLARLLEAAGKPDEAAAHYGAARDLDTVRWRIGSDFNTAVRGLAAELGGGDVILADVAAHLEREAGGPPGAGLFLEHVHPSLDGNLAIAEAIARAIGASPAGRQLGRWDWERHLSLKGYAERIGIDELDLIIALQTAAALHRTVTPEGGPAGRLYADLLTRVAQLQAGLDEPQREAWEQAASRGALTRPDGYDLLRLMLAAHYAERGEFEAALREVEKARRYGYWQLENPRYAALFVMEASLRLEAGEPEAAAEAARKALALDPGRPGALERLQEARRATASPGGMTDEARKEP